MKYSNSLTLLALCLWAISTSTAMERPNVILIVADDLGYADLSCYGASDIKTPHLDKLASGGLKFTQFYAGSAVCSASRAALLTGCYPVRVGIPAVVGAEVNYGLSRKEHTLAEALKQVGYRTGLFGKWHLGSQMIFRPSQHGFDENYGTIGSNDMGKRVNKVPPSLEMRRKGLAGVEVLEGDQVVETNPDQRFLTRKSTTRALDFIERHSNEPFFVYVPYNMPHTPLFVSPKWEGTSQRGLYGDVIQEMDHEVGRILNLLEEKKLEEKTIVIFTSDNGPWLIFGNHGGLAGPLSGGKKQLLEGGPRVPCILRYPKALKKGLQIDQLVSAIDLAPTIIKWCHGQEATQPIDGIDMRDFFENPQAMASPRKHLAYYDRYGLVAVRNQRYKLFFPHLDRQVPNPEKIGMDGMRGEVMKIKKAQALYDLKHDLSESRDLQKDLPDVVKKLTHFAKQQRSMLGDDITSTKGTANRPSETISK